MAQATTHIHSTGNPFSGFFRALFDGVLRYAESNSRLKQVEQLQSLSDEELTAKGIRRDDIVRHVFRNVLYI